MRLFDFTDLEAAQILRALTHYEAALKVNGTRLAPGLMQLKLHLTARSSQETRTQDVGAFDDDNELMLPILIETRTAAEALSLSQRAVSRLIANGSLPSVKVGGARRVHRADLVAFAEGLRRKDNDGQSIEKH